jgi:hypothetical protein
VSHEDVNVDVDRDEVRAVEKNEVLACHGTDNPKTKWNFVRSLNAVVLHYARAWGQSTFRRGPGFLHSGPLEALRCTYAESPC